MSTLRQVLFRFDQESELHYLPRTPEVGERVAHRGELWTIVRVEFDGVGTVAVCKRADCESGDPSGTRRGDRMGVRSTPTE